MGKKEATGSASLDSVVAVEPEPAPVVVVAPPVVAQPRMSFDIWFKFTDRSAAGMNQPHHKAGMATFADIKGKRTKQEWDRLFAGY